MVIDSVFKLQSAASQPESESPFISRMLAGASTWIGHAWCGLHGHLILMHFEPNRLSLQCGLCGYQSEGWEIGRPPARRQLDNRVHSLAARVDRPRTLHGVSSGARMAS